MHEVGLSTQWLIQGAKDLLRGNAHNGTTQLLKLAHFSELYDMNIELNHYGGLFGHIHAHLGYCIDNTGFIESDQSSGPDPRKAGQAWGITNAPIIEDGHVASNDLPGWGAEFDEDKFTSLIVEEHGLP